MFEFFSLYSIKSTFKRNSANNEDIESDKSDDDSVEDATKMKMLNSQNHVYLRKKPAIVTSTYFDASENEEDYLYGLMLLYIPFRNEDALMDGFSNVKNSFLAKENLFRKNHSHFENIQKFEHALQTAINRARIFLNETPEITQNETNENFESSVENIDEKEEEILNCDEKEIPDVVNLEDRIRALNCDQLPIFNQVKSHLSSDQSIPLFVCIHGYGGTGKSFLAKVICDLVDTFHSNGLRNCIVSAPTGVAAKNISGITNHNAFRLPIEHHCTISNFKPLTGKLLEAKRRQWRHVKWVVLDEMSMISYEQFRLINLRLQEFKNNKELFGGCCIILMGDLLQLEPVVGYWIFEQPEKYRAEINLWDLFKHFQLKMNQRQINDSSYGALCCRIRIGQPTAEDLATLTLRLLSNLENKEEFEHSLWLIGRKKDVASHNNAKFDELKSTGVPFYPIDCVDTYADGKKCGEEIDKSLLYEKIEQRGGIEDKIEIAVGCRVMLRRNLNVPKGVVSGAMGTIEKIKWTRLQRTQQTPGDLPEEVSIRFDDPQIAVNYGSDDGCVVVKPIQVTFPGKRNTLISRTMIPLILCWAVTIHKVQGLTLDKTVIDLGNCFSPAMEYVALSRVKTLEGLAISRIKYDRFVIDKLCSKKALAELKKHFENP